MKKIFFLIFSFSSFLFAKWNNNYSFFSENNNNAMNAVLEIISYILIVFGAYLFFHSIFKIFVSDSPQDKTRGALLTNILLLILSVLFVANQWVIKKTLGIG